MFSDHTLPRICVCSKVFKFFFQAFSKKRSSKFLQAKKVFNNFFFRRFPLEENKKGLRKFSVRFLALSNKILTVQKIVLSSSRVQDNLRELEASRPRTSKSVLEAKNVIEDSTSVAYYTYCTIMSLRCLQCHTSL